MLLLPVVVVVDDDVRDDDVLDVDVHDDDDGTRYPTFDPHFDVPWLTFESTKGYSLRRGDGRRQGGTVFC